MYCPKRPSTQAVGEVGRVEGALAGGGGVGRAKGGGQDGKHRGEHDERKPDEDGVVQRALGRRDPHAPRSEIRFTARVIRKMTTVRVTPMAAAEPTCPVSKARR